MRCGGLISSYCPRNPYGKAGNEGRRSYFASRGKIAPRYFVIWWQNSPNDYFAASAKIALSLILTQTQTLILTLIPTLTLTQTLTQTEKNTYLPLEPNKIATSFSFHFISNFAVAIFIRKLKPTIFVVVAAHIYSPVIRHHQTLSYWTIRTLFISMTTS